MHVYRSNRTEVLVEQLATVVSEPLGAPTAPECIVVQGPGMQRWLTMRLAERLGVWANPEFPFPRTAIENAVRSVTAEERTSVFEPATLYWAVATELSAVLAAEEQDPVYAVLQGYLAEDASGRKLFQLAERIAKTFDRYTVYRPKLVREWEAGQGEDWQACLWRAVVKRQDGRHGANQIYEFFQKFSQQETPAEGLPKRICLFGISALPPAYLQVLSALALRLPVHLFVLSPSREFWGDSERRSSLQEGNPLLLSMGKLAGDFQQVLEVDAEGYQEGPEEGYIDPSQIEGKEGTLLATLQSDILDFRHRRDKLPFLSGDKSVSVHSCHSPLRELEVLHDQLVARLDADPTLEASDIVVMAPNVESYAPLVDAVFGSDRSDRPRIPYRIADRADRSTAPVLQAYSQLLGTLRGRLTAPELLDLVTLAPLREKFELKEDELPRLRKWVVDSGIRWGADAQHREQVEQPAFVENTWRFGLDRLLLGYAMVGQNRDQFGGVLPFDDMEGSVTETLGKFVNLCETLFSFRDSLLKAQSVEAWSEILLLLLGKMLAANEDNVSEHQLVRDAIARVVSGANDGGFAGAVPFETVANLLESFWEQGDSVRGFLSGGVTFCQLMPMRSIPFRMVCVLGMGDGEFPRSPEPLGFDLLARHPKVGDRSARDDDRYLFLEAILSARDALLITYVGQSIQNNVKLPPSVLVGELLDVLEDSFTEGRPEASLPTSAASLRSALLVEHPLQPFSPSYYGASPDSRLFSYSVAYCDGARSLVESSPVRRGFLSAPIVLAEDPVPGELRELSLRELIQFFQRPTQVWMERRLGLFSRREEEALAEREPLGLAGLEGYDLGSVLLQRAVLGEPLGQMYPSLRAAGRLPLGTVGSCALEELRSQVSQLSDWVLQLRQGEALPNSGLPGLPVDVTVGTTRVLGELTDLWPSGRVVSSYSRLGGKAELGHWILHLFLCDIAPNDYQKRTVMVGRAEEGGAAACRQFLEVPKPRAIIQSLLDLYWAGQEVPLPFFPDTSRAFVQALKGEDARDTDTREFRAALGKARDKFRPASRSGTVPMAPSESMDVNVRRVFDVRRCLEPDYLPFPELPAHYAPFPRVAETVFSPLLRAQEKVTL